MDVSKYEVRSKRGSRLRDHRCKKCGAILGRHAGTRASPAVKAARAVEMLAQKMKWPVVTP